MAKTRRSTSSPRPSALARLDAWHSGHCDGRWEHLNRVSIEALDNPGWLVRVELDGTGLDGRPFPAVREGFADGLIRVPDWLSLRVVDAAFVGTGGPGSLEGIVGAFLDWAEGSPVALPAPWPAVG